MLARIKSMIKAKSPRALSIYRAIRSIVTVNDPQDLWPALLDEVSDSTPNVFFVEIGGMDGITNDPLCSYVRTRGWRGLVVEPLPDLYGQLVSTYDGQTGVICENVAIADHPGEKQMYRVPLEAINKGLVPLWAKGISSFYNDRNALGGQRISQEDYDHIRRHMVQETVTCETLPNLLSKHSITKIDVVQIDVEGYDYHILKQLDFHRFKPQVIRMEWYNLPDREKQLSLELLKQHGYRMQTVWNVDTCDVLAWTRVRLLGKA